jgi:hypothetical protein
MFGLERPTWLVQKSGSQTKEHIHFSVCQDLHLDLDSLQKPRRREDKVEVVSKKGEARGTRTRDYIEEMQIVREAIASLRSMFR